MMRPSDHHPLVFEHAERFRHAVAGRTPALFLDYDGTLTPIVDRPELARLTPETRRSLERRAATHFVAIVSGRELADVRQLVGVDGLVYAGSHGFDIEGPDGLALAHAEGAASQPALQAAAAELGDAVADFAGALVEPKRYGVAVHYRLVEPGRQDELREAVRSVRDRHRALRLNEGKMVLELQPDLDWHKGAAVRWLIDVLELDRPDIVPVYVGDDTTDEDAFASLADDGLGVLVADRARATGAQFRLRNPDEVRRFLDELETLATREGARPS
ncbi:MAG: trehalose-phosphatase [Gemmatimonadales bacterium]|jgi:alpha,alpha-trehalase